MKLTFELKIIENRVKDILFNLYNVKDILEADGRHKKFAWFKREHARLMKIIEHTQFTKL